ncbi:MAG: Gfo/Idh/MocA family oxidoreductase [Gemmataceae bacterium]|nr:Gfo/Idh/MocA family oxidoreductase [Gemmataceae bacterium]
MKKLRWGILGVAKINDRLVPGFRKAQLGELAALASRDEAKAREAARAAGVGTAHGSYEALLADPSLDAVYIPLPNTLHYEWVRRAADAGKHVLCEKPLTPTAPMAEELVAHCQARGVKLMDGFMWPHHPRTAAIRKLIDEGSVGHVRRVSGAFTFQLPMDPANIRLKPDMAGGALLDVGCYPVFGIRWAFGAEPVSAFASAEFSYDVDVAMSGVLTFADGRQAGFDCGFTAPMRQWLEITGETGVVRVADMWLPSPRASFVIERDGRAPETVTLPEADQIACMLDDFNRAVLQGEPVRPDPSEAARTLRVLDALALSAREGRPVDV